MSLTYYQANFPTRENVVMNRCVKTTYYLGEYKGIDLSSVNRTEKEIIDNFHLELMNIDDFIKSTTEESDNPRKKYFDRENKEILKELRLIKK